MDLYIKWEFLIYLKLLVYFPTNKLLRFYLKNSLTFFLLNLLIIFNVIQFKIK